MNYEKRSMDSISFQLTEQHISIDSRHDLQSGILEYSKSKLSIQQPQQGLESPLPSIHIHPQLLPIKQNSNTARQKAITCHQNYFKDNKQWNVTCEQLNKSKHLLYPQQKLKYEMIRNIEHPNHSISSKIHKDKSRSNQTDRKKYSLPAKAFVLPKSGFKKQNQQTYQFLKERLNSQRKKYQINKTPKHSEKNDFKKCGHTFTFQKQNLINNFLTQKMKLDHNQIQEKKYLQRLLINRQSILHISPKFSNFSIVQQS